jgi:lipopolysaccharide transport system ATP-binding protein
MLSNQIASETFPTVAQEGYWSCTVKKLPLAPGNYTLNLIVRQNDVIQDWIQEAATIAVEAGDFFSTGRIPPPTHGGVFIEQKWAANSANDDGAICPKFEEIVAMDTK